MIDRRDCLRPLTEASGERKISYRKRKVFKRSFTDFGKQEGLSDSLQVVLFFVFSQVVGVEILDKGSMCTYFCLCIFDKNLS